MLFYSYNQKEIDTVEFIKLVKHLDPYMSIIAVYPKTKESQSPKEIQLLIEDEAKDAGALEVMRKPYNVDSVKRLLVISVDVIRLLTLLKDAIVAFFRGIGGLK